MSKKHFLDLEPEEIERWLAERGESSFRARQLIEWVYQKRVETFAQCGNLPWKLRECLDEAFRIYSLTLKGRELSRRDGTARYRFAAADGATVSAVFLPKKDRNSVCLSTQVGCAVGCGFCRSGKLRFRRNLSRGEIIEQILQVEKEQKEKVNSVLLMGMGEPLLNYDNVVAALRAMVSYRELGFGRRHVTVSTVGIVPGIRRLAGENLGVRLALSLHAPDDETRKKFVPDRIPYRVKEILSAGLFFSRKNRSRLTLEYVLVPGVNDTLQSAKKLVTLIKESTSPHDEIRVNLIACNEPAEDTAAKAADASARRFKEHLAKNRILAIVREPKGRDIGAGCGQLGV